MTWLQCNPVYYHQSDCCQLKHKSFVTYKTCGGYYSYPPAVILSVYYFFFIIFSYLFLTHLNILIQ